MFKLNYFGNDFSTQHMIRSQPEFYVDKESGLIIGEKKYYGRF